MDNIDSCSLPELAAEIKRLFAVVDDNKHSERCGCEDWCECWNLGYVVDSEDLYRLGSAIDEFVRRMK